MIDRILFINLPHFDEYWIFIQELFEQGKTTGENQSESYLNYTQLSLARTRRGLKTLFPSEELIQTATSSNRKNWLLITEAWCGDAGNIIPLIANLAKAVDNVDLRILIRDERPEIMDLFLTNGSRSIPIFVAMNDSMEYADHWGPRPAPAQKMVMDNKHNPQPGRDFHVDLQKWYINDKGKTTDEELINYLKL